MSEAKAVQTEENRAKAEEEKAAPKFEESTQHVRQTENVHEYFKRKMAERMARMSGGEFTSLTVFYLLVKLFCWYLIQLLLMFNWIIK